MVHRSGTIIILTVAFLLVYSVAVTWLYVANRTNHSEYVKSLKHNNEQREVGYRLRIQALNEAGKTLELRIDSLADKHIALVRVDSLRQLELKRVKGSFDKLTNIELQNKMIEEYNKANE